MANVLGSGAGIGGRSVGSLNGYVIVPFHNFEGVDERDVDWRLVGLDCRLK